MAFRSSKDSRIYVGQLAASCYARSVSHQFTVDMLDTTTLCDANKQMIPGNATSTFSIDGPIDVDGSTDAQYDAITSLKSATTPAPITYMPLSTDGGLWLVEADLTGFTVSGSVTTTSDWAMSGQVTGETDVNGYVLENNTTVTADTDGTALDNGAATTNGAVFHLHVTAYSGFTSDDIIVEGSATGAFAGEESTVATFAQVTALGAERVEVTGSIPRHLRVADNVTGTGSITRLVAVSRR